MFATSIEKISEMPLRRQAALKRAIARFPGVRSADAATQRKIGQKALAKALTDPTLKMNYRRTVDV